MTAKSLHKKLTDTNTLQGRKHEKKHESRRARLTEDAKKSVSAELNATDQGIRAWLDDQDEIDRLDDSIDYEQALKDAINRYPHAREGQPTPLAERLGPKFLGPVELPDVVGRYPHEEDGEK